LLFKPTAVPRVRDGHSGSGRCWKPQFGRRTPGEVGELLRRLAGCCNSECMEEGGAGCHCVMVLSGARAGEQAASRACCRRTSPSAVFLGRGGQVACRKRTGVGKVNLMPLNKKWENCFSSLASCGEEGCAAGLACPQGCCAAGCHQPLVQPGGRDCCSVGLEFSMGISSLERGAGAFWVSASLASEKCLVC